MKELILATSNDGKISEFKSLLSHIKCTSQKDLELRDAEESGLTFIENAIIKARHASLHSEMPALADDSGIVVHALNGEPGIYSSRYAGKYATSGDNIAKLLNQLENTPDEQRMAFFYCCIVLVKHPADPSPIFATGRLKGFITRKVIGTEGFGYDPVFYIPSHQCTLAQLPMRIKNQISHRAQALNILLKQV